MKKTVIVFLFSTLFLLTVFNTCVNATPSSLFDGHLEGYVLDREGNPIAGVSVILASPYDIENRYNFMTNEEGYYEGNIPPGFFLWNGFP